MTASTHKYSPVLTAILLAMVACCLTALSALVCAWAVRAKPPARLPQLNERAISGPGSYELPRWSPDGVHLAYRGGQVGEDIFVYDIGTKKRTLVARDTSLLVFAWYPAGGLSYLKLRPDLSGNPFPMIYELRLVELDGGNDRVAIGNLHGPSRYLWLNGGRKVVISLALANPQSYATDLYIIDMETGATEPLVTRQELSVDDFDITSLSPDESKLLIRAFRGDYPRRETWFILYDLQARHVIREIHLDPLFENMRLSPYLDAGFGDDPLDWIEVEGKQWIVGDFYAPKGPCYNYAVMFFDLSDPSASFCLASNKGVISQGTISRDFKLAYTTVIGPGYNFIMIADLPEGYRARLAK